MELIAIVFMLAAGVGLAVFIGTATAIARRENERRDNAMPAPERDRIAASLLVHVLLAGGVRADEAMRDVRRHSGVVAPVTAGIDIGNWAEAFARVSSREQRAQLLEAAVQLIAARGKAVPVTQYAALLDLSFGLGFQTDALAKLRSVYGFEYVDHAKSGRPRESKPADDLLRVLGIEGAPNRQIIVAAYRKLVAQHHPDRFHQQDPQAQTDAAARFIEITRAYEQLMTIYRE